MDLTDTGEVSAPRSHDHAGLLLALLAGMLLAATPHLLLESYTTLRVTSLIPNPELSERAFEIRRLEAH